MKRAIFEETYNSDPIEVGYSHQDTEGAGKRTGDTIVFHPPLLDKTTKMVTGCGLGFRDRVLGFRVGFTLSFILHR